MEAPLREVKLSSRTVIQRIKRKKERDMQSTLKKTMLATGLAACYWPARRAARIDPLTVIRGDL